MSGNRLRVVIGVGVLVVWCGLSAVRSMRGSLWAFREAAAGSLVDSVGENAARFARIGSDLPADRPVGFVSDLPRDDAVSSFETGLVQAQSAIAPHLALDTDTLPLIIGDFRGAAPDSAQFATMGLRVVHAYGSGVFLLARSAP